VPEMHFSIEWPGGAIERCYSPSYVIEEHLTEGTDYPVSEFLERTARALQVASDRVQARYGFACSSALEQLAALRTAAAALSPNQQEGRVKVISFERHAPRDARAKRPVDPGPQGEST
jgi:uncharacterized repeat protein (TIGR04042 family)